MPQKQTLCLCIRVLFQNQSGCRQTELDLPLWKHRQTAAIGLPIASLPLWSLPSFDASLRLCDRMLWKWEEVSWFGGLKLRLRWGFFFIFCFVLKRRPQRVKVCSSRWKIYRFICFVVYFCLFLSKCLNHRLLLPVHAILLDGLTMDWTPAGMWTNEHSDFCYFHEKHWMCIALVKISPV